MARTFTRPLGNRVIAGVCAALAARFSISPTLVRLLFIASVLLPGPQVIVYVILWILIPSEKRAPESRVSGKSAAGGTIIR